MALHEVKVTGRAGALKVTVDGHSVDPKTVHVEAASVGSVPQVTITLDSDVALELEGVVHVVREPTALELAEVAAQQISEIDVTGLRELVGQRMTTLRHHPVDKTLEVIAELIAGEVKAHG